MEFYVLESKLTEFHGNSRPSAAARKPAPPPGEGLTPPPPPPPPSVSCRNVCRRTASFQKNHRAEELRVPRLEEGGV